MLSGYMITRDMCNIITRVSSLVSLDRETDVPDNTPPRPKFIINDTRLATTLQTNSVLSRLQTISYGADFLSGSVMCKLLERLIIIKDHIASLICDDKDFIN